MGFNLKKGIKKLAKPLRKVGAVVAATNPMTMAVAATKPKLLGIKNKKNQKLAKTVSRGVLGAAAVATVGVLAAPAVSKGLSSMMEGGKKMTPETGVKSLPQNYFKPAVLPGGESLGWSDAGEVHVEDRRAAAFASGSLYGTGLPFGLTVPQLALGLGGIGLIFFLVMRRS